MAPALMELTNERDRHESRNPISQVNDNTRAYPGGTGLIREARSGRRKLTRRSWGISAFPEERKACVRPRPTRWIHKRPLQLSNE